VEAKKYFVVFVVLFMFSSSLAIINVPVKVAAQPTPYVKVYVDQPLGYIPGVPVGEKVKVNIIIEVANITDNSAQGIVGWGLYVQVDPNVLNFTRAKGALPNYFLYNFSHHHGYPYPSLLSDIDWETGFGDIAEMISPLPSGGAGDPWSGFKLVTLEFTSKSETEYSKIDLFNVEYMTPDLLWHPVDEVVDGQYNQKLHDVAVTSIGFHHSTLYGNITVTTTYNTWGVNLIYVDAEIFNDGKVSENVTTIFTYIIASVSTTIGVVFVDVAAGSTEIASVSLDTGGFPVGYLPIKVWTMILNDVNTLNNMTTTLWIKQCGDVDGDGDVDRYDFGAFAIAYGYHYGQLKYNVECDFNRDGKVDRYDFGDLAQNYGILLPPYEPL